MVFVSKGVENGCDIIKSKSIQTEMGVLMCHQHQRKQCCVGKERLQNLTIKNTLF